MAFASVGSLGTANDKTAGTTIVLTATATAEVGNAVIVCSAWDNAGTSEAETSQLSLADSAGNTWTKCAEYTMSSGAANDGVTVAVWATKVTSQIDSGSDTFTVTSTSSRTASTIGAWEFTMGSGTLKFDGVLGTDYQVDGAAISDPASMSISGLTSREYLLIHVNGEERGATRTPDADYTERFDSVETTGGAANSNVSLWMASRIATLTGDTVDMASATDGDYAQILVALYEGTGAFSLDCQPGSYAVTGTAMTPLAARMIDAASGSYTLTGFAATTVAGRMIDAALGSYAVTGAAAGTLKNSLLNAEPGAYSVTGFAALVGRELRINAEPGAYSVTGAAAGILADRFINAAPGTYSVTGSDAGVVAGRVLSADPGTYTVTGVAATLQYDPVVGAFVLNAEPGTYSVTGASAGVVADRMIAALPGTYELTGTQAAIVAGRALDAQPGNYVVTGAAAGTLAARVLAALPGEYSVTGFLTGLVKQGVALYIPPAIGPVNVVAPEGQLSLLIPESTIQLIHAEGEFSIIEDADGGVTVIGPEGDIWLIT